MNEPWPDSIHGLPFFRQGDNVFIIGQLPKFDLSAFEKQAEWFSLREKEYDCPFDFLREHDQWFEWMKRLHGYHQTTGQIICSMLGSDVERIKRHQKSERFRFQMHDMTLWSNPRVSITGVTV